MRFIFRLTGNQPLAEDILHDVMTELLDAKDLDFTDDGLKSWLFTVAKNKSLNVLKKNSREVSSPELIENHPASNLLEEKSQLEKNLEKLKNLTALMPTELSETWQLRQQGLDYQEIADRLAIPLGTVKSRFHRLIAVLRKEFEND